MALCIRLKFKDAVTGAYTQQEIFEVGHNATDDFEVRDLAIDSIIKHCENYRKTDAKTIIEITAEEC